MSVIGTAKGIAHGTVKGYKQHIYRKVDACDDCKRALREARAENGATLRRARKEQAQEAAPLRLAPMPPPTPPVDRPHIGAPIEGRDLVVGDVIVHLGRHYPVDHIEPYAGGLHAALGEGTRTACSGTWGMTVGPDSVIRILPRPGGTS